MATGLETWVPSIVSAGALTLVWFNFRKSNSDADKKIKEVKADVEKKMEEVKKVQGSRFEIFLTKDSHGLLCENASLRFEKHVSTEMEKLEKTLAGQTAEILKEIKNGR